jgi:Glucose-6-phosphate dehydrogenase, NAD binding domain
VIRHLVIFGASGDLTARYLLPSLAQLYAAGKLPEGLAILGLGRRDWETDTFRRYIAAWLDRMAAPLSATTREAVLAMLQYRRADVTRSQEVAAAVPRGKAPIVAYLALAPALFAPTIEALAATGLPGDSRIVIEKPFGEDLASAQALNRLLHETFPERAVFRVDHFLGMQTVQNILPTVQFSGLLQPVSTLEGGARLIGYMWPTTYYMHLIAQAFYPPYFQEPQPIPADAIDPGMDQGRFMFVLNIPPRFEADVLAGRQPDIQVLIDATAVGQAGSGRPMVLGGRKRSAVRPGLRAVRRWHISLTLSSP